MISFRTANSIYHIDLAGMRIQRLSGVADPTPHQGTDGSWKQFYRVGGITIGEPVLIVWGIEEGIVKTTVTSPVVSVVCEN